eukprot:XP_001700737.1 predicted protein [Chlamydomonas reinhardtii]
MSPWGTSRAGLLAVLSVMLWWTKVAGAEQHIERHGADTAAGAQSLESELSPDGRLAAELHAAIRQGHGPPHCDPPGLRGLYSALDEKLDITPEALALGEMFEDVPRSGGWDRTILNGNCVMISLDFWFSSLVQRFVQLCRASGGSVMYRWNEQAVLGMVAQIFASQEQLLMFTFPYAHRIAHTDALKMGGLAD